MTNLVEQQCREAEVRAFGENALVTWAELAERVANRAGQVIIDVEAQTATEVVVPEQRQPLEMPFEAQVA